MSHKKSNSPYNLLAQSYDESTNLAIFNIYKSMIGEVGKQRILDLGCGTGMLLEHYSSNNETYGIDESPEMIKIARGRDKNTDYSIGNIRDFKMDKKFNLIVCAYDTINHLPTIKDWNKLFKNVANHLDDDGIFIFDFVTPQGFKNYGGYTSFTKIGDDYLIKQVESKDKVCHWEIHSFTKTSKTSYNHQKAIVKEYTFLKEAVIQKIKTYFTIVKIQKEKNNRLIIKTRKKRLYSY